MAIMRSTSNALLPATRSLTLGALTMDWISSELMRRVRSEFVSSDRGSL